MSFQAYRVSQEGDQIKGHVCDIDFNDLTSGEVLIEAHFSSINYKDALAGTGRGKIMKSLPLIGGIDVSGVVVESTDKRFIKGENVLVTGYDLGVGHDGGYAHFVRVPADWVVKVPANLSLNDAMVVGTAGFTAALAIFRLEQNLLNKNMGKVVVTGATGGVGSLAIEFLHHLGYEVTAITGKKSESDYLKLLGAKEVWVRGEFEMGERPLEKALWAGAIDTVGSGVLAWLTRTVNTHGSIASCGLAAGIDLHTTVMPFILRGINLLGIDSVACPMKTRLEVWHRIANTMKPDQFKTSIKVITLNELNSVFEQMMNGKTIGRYVVKIK
ncbi:putative acrylyl-CoA reductase AcuI [Ferrovum sp. JA12]|uniref:oxidoreductase n=1 Tax=Ferrovum sp. JA12 TaxID=1356299 RepID=UPI000703B80F|nr:oxidoreductase [Ferrovum sp. JA12]KRH78750.1 putative acrylyl-CoA reductase AcuI [Ferrovum sp. JA12]